MEGAGQSGTNMSKIENTELVESAIAVFEEQIEKKNWDGAKKEVEGLREFGFDKEADILESELNTAITDEKEKIDDIKNDTII